MLHENQRLHIAAIVLSGIASNPNAFAVDDAVQFAAKIAIELADALIAEEKNSRTGANNRGRSL